VTAAAWAAAAAVLVGGGLFAEDARAREGGGSRGLVVGGCFARCKQVQGISANAFSVLTKCPIVATWQINSVLSLPVSLTVWAVSRSTATARPITCASTPTAAHT